MTHALKTWPYYFNLIDNDIKDFEIRKNDRDFKVGDTILLQEWDPVDQKYTRKELSRVISYILSDEQFGVKPGYVILSIKRKEF